MVLNNAKEMLKSKHKILLLSTILSHFYLLTIISNNNKLIIFKEIFYLYEIE